MSKMARDSSKQPQKLKFPIIYYEEAESDGRTNPIPYIEVDKEEPWPFVLFIQEYRHTGEFEPDHQGNPSPILDMIMHQYVDMNTLKEKLSQDTYDIVRTALGMKPLKEAQHEGAKILDKVEKNVAEQKAAIEKSKTKKSEKTVH